MLHYRERIDVYPIVPVDSKELEEGRLFPCFNDVFSVDQIVLVIS